MRPEFSQPLLGDRLAPITTTIGFLEADRATAVAAFLEWREPYRGSLFTALERRTVVGDLETILRALLPLTLESCRYLFVPTAGSWTAFFDNFYRGPEPVAALQSLAGRLRCRGVHVITDPGGTAGRRRATCWSGAALVLEVYGPSVEVRSYVPRPEERARFGLGDKVVVRLAELARSIWLEEDMGQWQFRQQGHPLPFENTARYRDPTTKERFTFDMLRAYLAELGIRAFEEDFYAPDGIATLIEEVRPTVEGEEVFTLEEAQARCRQVP